MTNLTDIRSSAISAAGAGLTVYATKEDLPSSGLTSGDQAYVTANSRLYVSNGSGWYNVALINATPSLSIDPTGTIVLSTTGETTTITLTATDSDNAVAGLTYSVESDGSFGGLASLSQDSSVFTITPLSEDSATTTSAVLTFKASDGISFGTGSRTLTLSFKVENSNYTTALVKADTAGTDNQVDASSNTLTITETGVTSTAFSPYHPGGYSTYFDGSNDYITYNFGGSAFAANNFTIEGWYYFTGLPSLMNFWGMSNGGGTNAKMLFYFAGGNLTLECGSLGDTPLYYATSNFSTNTWYHIAVTREGTGANQTKLWVNGTNVTSGLVPDVSSISGNFRIGQVGESESYFANNFLTGYLRDFRITQGAALYTSTFTPNTSPLSDASSGTTIVLTCNGPIVRETSAGGISAGHVGSITGSPEPKRFGPYDYLGYNKTDHGGSVYFDGSGDYLAVANNQNVVDWATGSWTLEFWMNAETLDNWNYVAGSEITSAVGHASYNSQTNYWSFGPTAAGGIQFYYYNGSSQRVNSASTGIVRANCWHHLAAVQTGGTLKCYVDGVERISHTVSGTPLYDGVESLVIGSINSRYIDGWITDLRVVSDAVYTTDFTPPSAPLTAITNTELLTCTNKNDIWDAGTGSILTKNGNATSSNTQRKFTTSSATYFDGTGDYVDITSNKNNMRFASGTDFTVELWAYLSTVNTRNPFIAYGTGVNANPLHKSNWNLFQFSGSLYLVKYDGSTETTITKSWTPSSGTWYHIAVSRASGNLRFFIDGTEIGTTSTSNTTTFEGATDSDPIRIGYSYIGGGDNYLNGYIQDVRITKGLARYTSNFTPPTAEFSG